MLKGDVSTPTIHGCALGSMVGTVPDAQSTGPTVADAGVLEGVVPALLGAVVDSLGPGRHFDAAPGPQQTRRRSPSQHRSQDNAGKL